jgi:hypothetical protein
MIKTITLTGHPTLSQVRFGRKRPVSLGPHFKIGDYMRATLPTPPASADYSAAAMANISNIFGNDTLGDCIIAAGYHLTGVETGNAGDLFIPTTTQYIADYSAIGGYVPGDPSTDNGCDEVTALNYWTTKGFQNGTKLAGWTTVDATNPSQLMTSCYLFEGGLLTLELPDTFTNPFPSVNGFTWGGGTPDPSQGHGIAFGGYDSKLGYKVYTWGMWGWFSFEGLAELCTQAAGGGAYLVLSPDQIAKGAAKSPNGFAWNDLISDLDAFGAHIPVPAPAPTPPPSPTPPVPPSPAPQTGVTLAQAQGWATSLISAGHPLLTKQTAIALARTGLAASWPSAVGLNKKP